MRAETKLAIVMVVLSLLVMGYAVLDAYWAQQAARYDTPETTGAPATTPETTPATTPAPETTGAPATTVQQPATEELEVPATTEEPATTATPTPTDVDVLAQLLWTEARGVRSRTEQAAVIWCVLNRVDAGLGSDPIAVATDRAQFAYDPSAPILDDLRALAQDVLERWQTNAPGRVLPQDYMWFRGKDGRNWFRNSFNGEYDIWDWSWDSPYDS